MSRYFRNIFDGIYTVLVGMGVTLKHLFMRNVTVQYPDVHPLEQAGTSKMPENARNRLKLESDICNGCNSCVRACPVSCIDLETIKVAKDDPEEPKLADGKPRKLWVSKYDIDFAKCCFCNLCCNACPTEAIHATTEFEYSTHDREELIYHFSDMSPEKVADKKNLAAEAAKKAAAAKQAAAAKKLEEAKKKKEEAEKAAPAEEKADSAEEKKSE